MISGARTYLGVAYDAMVDNHYVLYIIAGISLIWLWKLTEVVMVMKGLSPNTGPEATLVILLVSLALLFRPFADALVAIKNEYRSEGK